MLTSQPQDADLADAFKALDIAFPPPARTAPRPHNPALATFDPRLAWEIALGTEPAPAIFERYGYGADEAAALSENALFQAEVKRHRAVIEKEGASFKQKARMIAESILPFLFDDATSENTHAEDRLKIVQWLSKIADLEPKSQAGAAQATGFTLNISMPGMVTPISVQAGPPVIEGTATRVRPDEALNLTPVRVTL